MVSLALWHLSTTIHYGPLWSHMCLFKFKLIKMKKQNVLALSHGAQATAQPPFLTWGTAGGGLGVLPGLPSTLFGRLVEVRGS